MTESQLVDWRGQFEIAQRRLAGASETSGDSKFISTKGGLSIDGDALPGNRIECVILAAAQEHTYYPAAYQDGVTNYPSCFALGRMGEMMRPHERSLSLESDACEGCHYREWKQSASGKYLPLECKTYVRLALLPAECIGSPETIAENQPYVLRVPPVSAKKHFHPFAKKVSKIGPLWAVTTAIEGNAFDLTFTALAPIEQQPDIMNALSLRSIELEDWLLQPREQVES